jgi:hypothetical protein
MEAFSGEAWGKQALPIHLSTPPAFRGFQAVARHFTARGLGGTSESV